MAVIEELLKYTAASTIFDHPDFDEPVDGLIYAASASLGFAFIENIIYSIDFNWQTTLLRGSITTLGHVLFSLPWGFAMSLKKFGRGQLRYAFVLSIVLHTVLNVVMFYQQPNVIWLLALLVTMVGMYLLSQSLFKRILQYQLDWLPKTPPPASGQPPA